MANMISHRLFSQTLNQAELEIHNLDETIESINGLKPNCDKLDYILAASSGALCGIIDIFLVGKPGESLLEILLINGLLIEQLILQNCVDGKIKERTLCLQQSDFLKTSLKFLMTSVELETRQVLFSI